MTTQIKEFPFVLYPHEVRGILEGRQTQLRRIVKPQPDDDGLWDATSFPRHIDEPTGWKGATEADGESRVWRCPYGQPGDRLWGKETWADLNADYPNMAPQYVYRADWGDMPFDPKWRSSVHMPRAASRILLEIADIRVERLQDISVRDAVQEGYPREWDDDPGAIPWFIHRWQSIHGADAWDRNDWVWVRTVKRIEP